jgi:phenylacetate-coenzyme A ligase PaaK-like adenylate-forming protein
MYRWLVPWVIFPLSERLGGRQMWTEARRLRELQWLPQGELEAGTLIRLRSLLRHAAAHVPYYRDLFKQAGMDPEDIRTLSDLSNLPITMKADLRAGFPCRTTADNLPEDRGRKMMTSGSTGLPFEFYWDRSCADALIGAYFFSLEWAGAAIWDTRIAIVVPSHFPTNIAPSPRFRQVGRRILLGERTVNLPADDLSALNFRAIVNDLSRRRRYFIRGYPYAITRLAVQLSEESTALKSYPQMVMTYSETLTAANAASIKRAFRCEVVNYYTSWEVPQMAQTCPDNPAVLHVNSDRVILRVVRPDGTTAPPGEPGRVVVTDLANHVMPFINYFIGDRAVAGLPCPCGRGFPTLTALEGRETEVIRTPGGKLINGGVLGHFLAFEVGVIPYIWEYQAVQKTPDAVMLRIVPTAHFTPEFARMLHGKLEAFLGPGIRVNIEPVDGIPREPSGKRLIIKFLLAQE